MDLVKRSRFSHYLKVALQGVSPKVGEVSIGKRGDKATWRVEWLPGATQADFDAVAAFIAAADADAIEAAQPAAEKVDASFPLAPKVLAALALRASSGWLTVLTAQERNAAQAIIDDAAQAALGLIRNL